VYDALVSTILVAAGVLIESDRVLIAQRKTGTHLEGKWEFPGGKVEQGEDPRDALARELREEIGIDTSVGEIVEVTFHAYEERSVLLLFYDVTRLAGSPEPRAIDAAAVAWVSADELRAFAFPAADVAILGKVEARLRRAPRAER
jgi:8-oxo-dGTP diphosphatase